MTLTVKGKVVDRLMLSTFSVKNLGPDRVDKADEERPHSVVVAESVSVLKLTSNRGLEAEPVDDRRWFTFHSAPLDPAEVYEFSVLHSGDADSLTAAPGQLRVRGLGWCHGHVRVTRPLMTVRRFIALLP